MEPRRREDAKTDAKEKKSVFDFLTRDEPRADDRTEELARLVIGAAIEVHRHMGPGLPESAYRLALSHELILQGIEHECEFPVDLNYKGLCVGQTRLDMVVGGVLIVELKVVESLAPVHRAQVIAYLQATKLKLGLLINFNVPILKDGVKRVINLY